jgi:polar amino acid transport system ATP-binding protein
MAQTPVLSVENVSKTLGGNAILRSVSLDLYAGQHKVLIGPSGGGKSTLLQCMNYLLTPDDGTVRLDGQAVDVQSRKQLYAFRQQVGMIFQEFNLFDHLTALDNVAVALRKVKRMPRKDAEARARAELDRVGLAERSGQYPAELSGGQKQRVSIARALAMDPKVMLLDEPTSALDPELTGEVVAVIRDLARSGMTMVMATHHMGLTRMLADEVLFMQEGRIIERGSPAELLADGAGTRTAEFCNHLS